MRVLFLSFFVLLPLLTIGQTRGDMQQRYLRYLQQQNFEAYIDRDGDVQFRAYGLNFFLVVDKEDLTFFRLVLPNFWPIESEIEYLTAQEACAEANRLLKGVKIYLRDNNVWLAVESFMARPDDFESFFSRGLSAARLGVSTFKDRMLDR